MDTTFLPLLIFIAAVLYASVGHAGASGYLAVMALYGIAPAEMKPAALVLNILVASIAVVQYGRVGAFSWRILLPLIVTSIPFAYLGGYLTLPAHVYKPVIGVVLLYATVYSFRRSFGAQSDEIRAVKPTTLSAVGAVLGLLSGLTGVGGGIFLSPILLWRGWAQVRTISGVSAAFILVNSVAGLLGVLTKGATLPADWPIWALAAVLGGYIGATLGSKHLNNAWIQRALALVLLIAGAKMVLAI
ncbi:MAG: sulfite exporter TauE/SafE family protein [Formosimonas sp.]